MRQRGRGSRNSASTTSRSRSTGSVPNTDRPTASCAAGWVEAQGDHRLDCCARQRHSVPGAARAPGGRRRGGAAGRYQGERHRRAARSVRRLLGSHGRTCRASTLDRLPFIDTTDRRARVRAAYNGGLVVARRAAGILQRWARLFERSIEADLRPWRGSASERARVHRPGRCGGERVLGIESGGAGAGDLEHDVASGAVRRPLQPPAALPRAVSAYPCRRAGGSRSCTCTTTGCSPRHITPARSGGCVSSAWSRNGWRGWLRGSRSPSTPERGCADARVPLAGPKPLRL